MHLTRGTPYPSTITAVPAWRIDWSDVALPSRYPWLVTRVSARSTTGVRDITYSRIVACSIPSASAQALPFSGFCSR
ncbi:MAG: hypothetical protein M5T61_11525 [Acidimicrobiia bacterium]|nr:hypothetical protein [Acidimicrobiia bacterium]